MEEGRSDFFLYAIALFVVFIIGEALYDGYRKQKNRTAGQYHRTDTWVNIFSGLGSFGAGKLNLLYQVVLFELLFQLSPLRVPYSWPWWLLCLVMVDFCHYWAHRFGHEANLGWAAHVTHHSSTHFNLSTAVRQSWTQHLTLFVFFLPIPLLGFPLEMLLVMKGVNGIGQFWIHTQNIGRIPKPISFVFNTPSHHRVHHASNPVYLDKNYGGVFIIWDRIFGTFQPELPEEPVEYGLTENIRTHNILRVQFHVWGEIFRSLFRAQSIKEVGRILFAAPGEQKARTEKAGLIAPAVPRKESPIHHQGKNVLKETSLPGGITTESIQSSSSRS